MHNCSIMQKTNLCLFANQDTKEICSPEEATVFAELAEVLLYFPQLRGELSQQ